MPDVSVIIPTYNSAAYIAETLASVCAQTFDSLEIIVIDDCSADATCDITAAAASNDSRIRLIKLDRNSGRPAVPRNIGIRASCGKFIAFLDSDDLWHCQKLEIQLAAIRSSGVSFCSSRMIRFTEKSKINRLMETHFDSSKIKTSRVSHKRLLHKNAICNSSVIVAREIILESPFIEDMRYKAIEDFHNWLTIHQRYGFSSIIVEAPLMFYRVAHLSISRSKLLMLKRNYTLFSEYKVGGRKLGLKRFFYIGSYIYNSLRQKLFGSDFRQ
ncbi:glycosyltransferase family 2 protein [Ignavibacteria bacterium]|nr:glycosyltransferase family 2 protein [Bacteroidota bacterium]MCZ2131734.1 glycosyltransferase family 2 protein [Bacteroidota bacterium]